MGTHRFFKGTFFNFEAIRILGTCRYGGAEVAECLEAIGHITDNDATSWHTAWAEQAERAEKLAGEARKTGQAKAARNAYLRASNYTRASAYMMTGGAAGKTQDPRVVPILHRATALFRKALDLFDGLVHTLQIPYQNAEGGEAVSLPAYLYLPPSSCRLSAGKTPVLVNPIGADSIQEEIFYMFPAAGPELGYAVLTYEGPGHGLTLHEKGLPMRPDWEVVNAAVLDALWRHAEDHGGLGLDLERVAIAGASLGAYFALRSAADSRIKACIAIDPLYDLWEFATEHVAPSFFGLWDRGWVPDAVVNGLVALGTHLSFQMHWEISTSSRFLGASSPAHLLRTMQKFSLRGGQEVVETETTGDGRGDARPRQGADVASDSFLANVTCPTLVTGAEGSLYFDLDSHTMRIFNELRQPGKELWIGSKPSEGGLQAKMGALGLCNQRAFEFLDRHFGIEPSHRAGSIA